MRRTEKGERSLLAEAKSRPARRGCKPREADLSCFVLFVDSHPLTFRPETHDLRDTPLARRSVPRSQVNLRGEQSSCGLSNEVDASRFAICVLHFAFCIHSPCPSTPLLLCPLAPLPPVVLPLPAVGIFDYSR
jgi:hypothetical protein